jgi:hypothetical protein
MLADVFIDNPADYAKWEQENGPTPAEEQPPTAAQPAK